MAFAKPEEIPPVIKKILEKLDDIKEPLEKDQFELLLINIRINKSEVKDIEKYLKNYGFIQRVPSGNKRKDAIVKIE